MEVHPGDVDRCNEVVVVSGLAEPCVGLRVVLRHAFTVAVHQAEVDLRVGAALVGGLAEPCDGLRVVLRHAFAVAVHRTEVDLRDGIPLIGQRPQNLEGRCVVAFLKGSHAVLKRSCHCNAEQGERKSAADKECGPRVIASRASGARTPSQ